MSKVFKDNVTITISNELFSQIILGYGVMAGSFEETESLDVDTIVYNGESVEIGGDLYQESIN